MAKVKIGTIKSSWELTQKEALIIHAATRARERGYQHSPSYKLGAWDGFIDFFDFKKNTLPAGLVGEACRALDKEGFFVEEETEECKEFPEREGGEIYYDIKEEHQLRVLESMCTEKRGVVHAATNAGKTKIAQAWCALHKLKILYLVPSRELLDQTLLSFRRDTNLDVGFMSAEKGVKLGKDVTVALVSSIAKRKIPKGRKSKSGNSKKSVSQIFEEVAEVFEAVIVDECHHAEAKTWAWVLKKLKNCHYRYGLSGSPWHVGDRGGELKVKAYLGDVISEVRNTELIEKAWSAKPKIKIIQVFECEELTKQNIEFFEIYERGITYNAVRNERIVSLCEKFFDQQKICLVISFRLVQCRLLSDSLTRRGIEHEILTGETDKAERTRILELFRAKKLPVLISTILGEGVDIPSLNGLIFASGGKSSKQLLQRVGRGLRRKPDSVNEVEIYDFLDNGFQFLQAHSKQRIKLYKQENFDVEILD